MSGAIKSQFIHMDSIPSLMNSMFEEYDTKLQKLGSVVKTFQFI